MTKIHKKLNMGILGVILGLAWPTMLEQLMQTAVQYIDTAMVGLLGTKATAAVGATTTVNWLVNSMVSAVGIGFLAIIAKALGAGDKDYAKRAVGQSVLCTLAVGLLFTLVTTGISPVLPSLMQVEAEIRSSASTYFFILYLPMLPRTATIIFGTVLRAAGDTKTPMKIGVLINLTNVILNFAMIYPTRAVNIFGKTLTLYGMGWGVAGAAVASAISFTVGGILITSALLKHPEISPKGISIRPDKTILKACFKIATPNMLQRFTTCMGYVTFASMINSIGEMATAAHTIANTVESAFYIPGYGMQTATATLIGNAYGAKNSDRMRELSRMFIPIETVLMMLSGAALFVSAPALMSIFSNSEEVITLGSTVLRMVAVSEPFFGLSIIAEGMLQGVGKTREPFLYNVVGMWAIRIGGTYICTQILHMGLVAAWGCMILHNIILCIMFVVNLANGKWNPLNRKD